MKNLKLRYLKIALIILTVHMLELNFGVDSLGFIYLAGAILFIEFIFGDLSSEAAKKLKLKESKTSSWFIIFILLLPGYALFIFSYSYLQDNNSESLMTITAAMFYAVICYHGFVIDFLNKRTLDRER